MNSDNQVRLTERIYVAKFRDIFWNNNSDLYPSNTPDLDLYELIEEITPIFHSAYSATCVLEGDYNHAFYNGKYYFLKKIDPIDQITTTFKYQLDEDIVLNLLRQGCNVRGTLIKTNKKDILEECLQTCVPILNNPTEREILNFKENKTSNSPDWIDQKKVEYALPKIETTRVLTRTAVQKFKNKCNTHTFKRFLKDKVPWRSTPSTGHIPVVYNTTEPLFTMEWLLPSFGVSWKNYVLAEVIGFLGLVGEEKKDNPKLMFVSQTRHNADYLNGKYCITYKDNTGIAGTEEKNIKITGIDLTKLSDIVPFNFASPTPLPPTTFTIDKLSDDSILDLEITMPLKLCRRPHLPFYTEEFNRESSSELLQITDSTKYTGNKLQELTWEDGTKGHLWYIDRLNFAVVDGFSAWYKDGYDEPITGTFFDLGYPDRYPWSEETYSWVSAKKTEVLPLGIKFFGLVKDSNWDDFLYKGEATLTTLTYIDGVKQPLTDASFPSSRWSAHGITRSRHTLTTRLAEGLDDVRWSLIMPSTPGRHKYFWLYDYGIFGFFGKSYDDYIGPSAPLRYATNFLGRDFNFGRGWKKPQDRLNLRKRFISENFSEGSFKPKTTITKGDIVFFLDDWNFSISPHMYYQLHFRLDESKRQQLPTPPQAFKTSDINWDLIDKTCKKITDIFLRPALGDLAGVLVNDREFTEYCEKDIKNRLGTFGEQKKHRQITPYTKDLRTYSGDFTYAEKAWHRLINTILTLGDFFGSHSLSSLLDKKPKDIYQGFVTYLYKNELHLGYSVIETVKQSLCSSSKVIRVDGKKQRDAELCVIKHIAKLDPNQDDMFLGLDSKIIDTYNKYNTLDSKKISELDYKITHEDLKDPNKQHIFNLVGTDWYALFANGKVHLIAKDNNLEVFSPDKEEKKLETTKLEKNLSVYEKINQKAFLVMYGKDRVLTTKFDLTKKVELTTRPVVVKNVNSVSEFYHVKMKTETDFINDWIQTVKNQKEGVQIATGDYEMLKLQLEKTDFEYIQQQQLNELAINRQRVKQFRENQDLDDRYEDAQAQIGLGGAGIAAGLVGSLISKNPIGAVGGLIAGGASLRAGITFLTRDYQKLRGRVEEDHRLFLQDNSVSLLQRKQNYEHNLKAQKIRLNSITNTYIRPSINDAMVQKQYNADNQLEDFQLHIYLPNTTQLKQITHIYDNYGCECLSYKFKEEPLEIKDGMDDGIYQFSELQPNFLDSDYTEDVFINNLVRSLLEAGIKFRYTEHRPTHKKISETKDVKKQVYDITKIPEWSRELWLVFKLETPDSQVLEAIKSHDKFGLTDDEYNTNKKYIDQIKTNDKHLFKAIDDIISNRQEGSIHVAEPHPEIADKVLLQKCLEDKQQLTDNITNLQTQLDECREKESKLTKEKEQIEKTNKNLVDEISKIKRDKETIEEDIKNLQQTKETLEENLRQCNINLKNIQQAKETCDSINATEQKKLKAEIGTLKQQIAEKTREKENLATQLNQATGRLSRIDGLTRQLTQQINTLNSRIQYYETQFQTLNLCQTIHKLVDDPYEINTTQKPTGELAKNLMMLVAKEKVEINNTDISNETKKYPLIQKLLNTIEDLEHIDGISIYEDAMSLDGWYKYEQYVKTGGTKDSDVDEVISVLNDLDLHLGSPKLQALKFVLDEIVFRAYSAKIPHSDKTKTDPDNPHKNVSDIDLDENLQYLLGGFITKWREGYKALYGQDIDNALKRKWFQSTGCQFIATVPQTIQKIQTIDQTVKYSTEGIPVQETPPDEHFLNYIDEDGKIYYAQKPFNCRLGITRQFITYKADFNFKDFKKQQGTKEYSVLYIESETKDYSRYWSIEAHSGYKYYTYYETKNYVYSYISKTGTNLRSARKTNQQTSIPVAFYCHWAGKLAPGEFFDRRYASWVSMIKQFEYAISHEDLRDKIKREKKLQVKIRTTHVINGDSKYAHKGKQQLYIQTWNYTRDFYQYFGKRDCYKALWIACVLTWNGLYMNKVWQGNDYWKFKIQPLWHPFHDLDKQEVINLMTRVSDKTKTIELGIEFGGWSTLVEIVSCILKGNYEVLKFTEVRRWLEGMNNVGYYEWTREKNADPNDYS